MAPGKASSFFTGIPGKGSPDKGSPDKGSSFFTGIPGKGLPDKGSSFFTGIPGKGSPDKGSSVFTGIPGKGSPDKGSPDKGSSVFTGIPGVASPVSVIMISLSELGSDVSKLFLSFDSIEISPCFISPFFISSFSDSLTEEKSFIFSKPVSTLFIFVFDLITSGRHFSKSFTTAEVTGHGCPVLIISFISCTF